MDEANCVPPQHASTVDPAYVLFCFQYSKIMPNKDPPTINQITDKAIFHMFFHLKLETELIYLDRLMKRIKLLAPPKIMLAMKPFNR